MAIISDLPSEVMEEILVRVPASSLRRSRLTCKRWNALVKDPSFTKKHLYRAPRRSLVVTNMSHRIYSMSFNLHLDPFIEFKLKHSLIDPQSNSEANIPEVFHCNGLFLCTIADRRLVVWNPCTGQTMWFKPREPYYCNNMYALGYSNSNESYKILRGFSGDSWVKVEIYEFCSNSWRVLDDDVFPNCFIRSFSGVSLKGDAYWLASPKSQKVEDFILLSFDFSTERFRCQSLPFRNHGWGDMSLAVVREEKLSVLHWRLHRLEVEIWLMTTTKTDQTTDVSWSNFLKVGLHSIPHLKRSHASGFFMDHDKKVIVCFYKYSTFTRNFVYVIGEEEEPFREIFLGEYSDLLRWPVTLNYVPSMVRLPEGIV